MIFDDVAKIMKKRSIREIQRLTGLRRDRIYSLRCGCTFNMDYDLVNALKKMGYDVKIVKTSGNSDS